LAGAARVLGCTGSTVSHYLHTSEYPGVLKNPGWRIPENVVEMIRVDRERVARNEMGVCPFTAADLQRLYVEEHLTQQQIAQQAAATLEYVPTDRTVRNWLRRAGIQRGQGNRNDGDGNT